MSCWMSRQRKSKGVDMNTYQNTKAQKVAGWIDMHSRPEPTVINTDGTLTVASVVRLASGEIVIERETIPATMAAARAVLGY